MREISKVQEKVRNSYFLPSLKLQKQLSDKKSDAGYVDEYMIRKAKVWIFRKKPQNSYFGSLKNTKCQEVRMK